MVRKLFSGLPILYLTAHHCCEGSRVGQVPRLCSLGFHMQSMEVVPPERGRATATCWDRSARQ